MNKEEKEENEKINKKGIKWNRNKFILEQPAP